MTDGERPMTPAPIKPAVPLSSLEALDIRVGTIQAVDDLPARDPGSHIDRLTGTPPRIASTLWPRYGNRRRPGVGMIGAVDRTLTYNLSDGGVSCKSI